MMPDNLAEPQRHPKGLARKVDLLGDRIPFVREKQDFEKPSDSGNQ